MCWKLQAICQTPLPCPIAAKKQAVPSVQPGSWSSKRGTRCESHAKCGRITQNQRRISENQACLRRFGGWRYLCVRAVPRAAGVSPRSRKESYESVGLEWFGRSLSRIYLLALRSAQVGDSLFAADGDLLFPSQQRTSRTICRLHGSQNTRDSRTPTAASQRRQAQPRASSRSFPRLQPLGRAIPGGRGFCQPRPRYRSGLETA